MLDNNYYESQADKALSIAIDNHTSRNVEINTAEDVASDILSNGDKNFDWTDWETLDDSYKAEAFDELVMMIASFRHDKALTHDENKSEQLSLIKDSLEASFTNWAAREIRSRGVRGL